MFEPFLLSVPASIFPPSIFMQGLFIFHSPLHYHLGSLLFHPFCLSIPASIFVPSIFMQGFSFSIPHFIVILESFVSSLPSLYPSSYLCALYHRPRLFIFHFSLSLSFCHLPFHLLFLYSSLTISKVIVQKCTKREGWIKYLRWKIKPVSDSTRTKNSAGNKIRTTKIYEKKTC